MKSHRLVLPLLFAANLLTLGNVHAQAPATPAPTPTTRTVSPEQAQLVMLQQMQMMAALFESRRSRLGFDETVSALVGASAKHGWPSVQIHDVQAAMKQAGATDSKRMKALSTCPPQANERLAMASAGKLPPLPCRYTVFEGQDGKVYVVRMNTPILAKTLQGDAARVMQEIASEEETVLKNIVE